MLPDRPEPIEYLIDLEEEERKKEAEERAIEDAIDEAWKEYKGGKGN